jgi:hypothetical protein
MSKDTITFTDTTFIIRGTVITIMDITTDHTISVMVTAHTLGFITLRTEPGFTSGSASDAAHSLSMMQPMQPKIFRFSGRCLYVPV